MKLTTNRLVIRQSLVYLPGGSQTRSSRWDGAASHRTNSNQPPASGLRSSSVQLAVAWGSGAGAAAAGAGADAAAAAAQTTAGVAARPLAA